jgi:hypothetical protein
MCRRRSVVMLSAAVMGVVAPGAWGISPGPLTIALEQLTDIGSAAIDLTHAGDERLFMAVQGSGTNAQVRLWKNNALAGTPFLDLNLGGVTIQAGGEKGLLGFTFHPNFDGPEGTPGRGKVYTYTSEARAGAQTTFGHPELGVNGGDHDSVIREWTVNPNSPDVVNHGAGSREILRVRQPQSNHNGGAMKFSPADGYLYVAMGDGGSGNDFEGSVGSTTDGHSNPHGNGQTLINSDGSTNLLGKVLRIDPLAPAETPGSADPVSGNGRYRVAAGNPFANGANRTEIFAYGLRNPFRASFDRLTGEMYAGDVGQGAREEVDRIVLGGNYGWPYREGSLTTTPRPTPPAGFTPIAPLAEYGRGVDGRAVIGGYVYRGANIPELYGKYVFGDLNNTPGIGRLFYMDPVQGATISEFSYYSGNPTSSLYSFGEDVRGELFAMFADGTVKKVLGRQWNAAGGGTWGAAGNWIGPVPAATGDDANFLREITAPATVTLDGNRTAGSLMFNSAIPYTVAQGSGGTLTINRITSAPAIKVLSGAHTVSAPLTVAGDPRLTIAAGASLVLEGPVSGKFGVPAIDPAGKLDLKTNDMIIDYGPAVASPLPGIRALLVSGHAGGAWGGNGITTTGWVGIGSQPTGLAYVEAARLFDLGPGGTATFGATTVDATTVLIKYTWYGDINFDGVVNADDYARMDRSFADGVAPGAAGWFDGDFDYDGNLTTADYMRMDVSFGVQSGALSPGFLEGREARFGAAYVSELVASVPEPGVVGLATPLLLLVGKRVRGRGRSAAAGRV